MKRQYKLLILAGLLAAVVFSLYKPWAVIATRRATQETAKKGFAYNDTGGKMPGDPRNGEKDLKDLFRWVSVYRGRHDGKYPTSVHDVKTDACQDPKAYSLTHCDEMSEKLFNPDNRFGDLTKGGAGRIIPYSIFRSRPDGSPLGGPKKPGEREAIAFTSLYVYQNIRNFSGERTLMNPAGVYLVLWEGGEVTRVPYDKVQHTFAGKVSDGSKYKVGFEGQAGTSPDALSYDDYYRKVLHANPPRGTPGGPGVPLASK